MPPEAIIRRKVRDAMRRDAPALQYLADIIVSRKDASGTVFKRSLPVISFYLNSPTPEDTPTAEDLMEEAAVMLCFSMLYYSMPRKGDDDPSMAHPAHDRISREVDNIIRWMSHLLTVWVLEGRDNFSDDIRSMISPAQPEECASAMQRKTLGYFPPIVEVMVRYPKTRNLVRDMAQFGTLLSTLTKVAVRMKKHEQLATVLWMKDHMLSHCGSGQLWETSFFTDLESQAHEFANDIISLLKDYIDSSISCTTTELPSALLLIKHCYIGDNIVFDKFLGQGGSIRTLASIFRGLVDHLVKNRKATPITRLPNDSDNVSLQLILDLSSILLMSFQRGGPPLLSVDLICHIPCRFSPKLSATLRSSLNLCSSPP